MRGSGVSQEYEGVSIPLTIGILPLDFLLRIVQIMFQLTISIHWAWWMIFLRLILCSLPMAMQKRLDELEEVIKKVKEILNTFIVVATSERSRKEHF